MRVIYRKIRHAHYLYIKRNVEKVLGCALSIEKYVMRVIYTSNGMSKKFGVRVIYRKIRYLKYVIKFKVCVEQLQEQWTEKQERKENYNTVLHSVKKHYPRCVY